MMRDRIDEILAYHTGKSKEQIHRDTERDKILSAPEAVEYGLVDRVDASAPDGLVPGRASPHLDGLGRPASRGGWNADPLRGVS